MFSVLQWTQQHAFLNRFVPSIRFFFLGSKSGSNTNLINLRKSTHFGFDLQMIFYFIKFNLNSDLIERIILGEAKIEDNCFICCRRSKRSMNFQHPLAKFFLCKTCSVSLNIFLKTLTSYWLRRSIHIGPIVAQNTKIRRKG